MAGRANIRGSILHPTPSDRCVVNSFSALFFYFLADLFNPFWADYFDYAVAAGSGPRWYTEVLCNTVWPIGGGRWLVSSLPSWL